MTVDRWRLVASDLTDQEWARLEPLLPSMAPQRGGRWREHRQVVNGILWRIDHGATWGQDGTWARIEHQLQADADAGGDLDWRAQADSSIVRAHQHAAGARKGG